MFGSVGNHARPLTETDSLSPLSPYAAAKVYAYHVTRIYRDAYGMFACNGMFFNHESPLRGLEFVTRKISNAVAKVKLGLEKELQLGNLDAKRDWGYAPDYVEAMWLMLQQDGPDDYVIATGETHSVREFVNLAFEHAGIELEWKGTGVNEKGIIASMGSEKYGASSKDKGITSSPSLWPTACSLLHAGPPKIGDVVVEIDPRYFRPLEVEVLQGDASKAKKKLNWEPKVRFKELASIMVVADVRELQELRHCQDVIRKLSNNKDGE